MLFQKNAKKDAMLIKEYYLLIFFKVSAAIFLLFFSQNDLDNIFLNFTESFAHKGATKLHLWIIRS